MHCVRVVEIRLHKLKSSSMVRNHEISRHVQIINWCRVVHIIAVDCRIDSIHSKFWGELTGCRPDFLFCWQLSYFYSRNLQTTCVGSRCVIFREPSSVRWMRMRKSTRHRAVFTLLLPHSFNTPAVLCYCSDCTEKRPYPQALDDDAARRLWDASVQLVRLEESMIHPLLRRWIVQ